MVGCLAAAEDDDDDDTTTSDKDKGREEVMATKTRREMVRVAEEGGFWPVERANLRQLETFFFAAF